MEALATIRKDDFTSVLCRLLAQDKINRSATSDHAVCDTYYQKMNNYRKSWSNIIKVTHAKISRENIFECNYDGQVLFSITWSEVEWIPWASKCAMIKNSNKLRLDHEESKAVMMVTYGNGQTDCTSNKNIGKMSNPAWVHRIVEARFNWDMRWYVKRQNSCSVRIERIALWKLRWCHFLWKYPLSCALELSIWESAVCSIATATIPVGRKGAVV